jgi:hypothetical protein
MSPATSPVAGRKSSWLAWLFGFLLIVALLFAGYTWIVLTWSYSKGERAGYVQKFSHKGWICKTWEGELAMVTMPGTVSDKFLFSVRDDTVAAKINETMGRRVALVYEEHRFVQTSCFGENDHFVTGIKPVEAIDYQTPPGTAPSAPIAPVAPAARPAN